LGARMCMWCVYYDVYYHPMFVCMDLRMFVYACVCMCERTHARGCVYLRACFCACLYHQMTVLDATCTIFQFPLYSIGCQ